MPYFSAIFNDLPNFSILFETSAIVKIKEPKNQTFLIKYKANSLEIDNTSQLETNGLNREEEVGGKKFVLISLFTFLIRLFRDSQAIPVINDVDYVPK